jgi:hypothetical protein
MININLSLFSHFHILRLIRGRRWINCEIDHENGENDTNSIEKRNDDDHYTKTFTGGGEISTENVEEIL